MKFVTKQLSGTGEQEEIMTNLSGSTGKTFVLLTVGKAFCDSLSLITLKQENYTTVNCLYLINEKKK